jgi:hypothetical protein
MIYANLNTIERYTNDGIGEISDPTIYQQTGNRGGINSKKHKKLRSSVNNSLTHVTCPSPVTCMVVT